MIAVATVVDWQALADTAVASLVAGVVVTLTTATAIYGAATFADAQRGRRYGAAALGALLATLGVLGFGAAIAAGLYVMING